jgi:hypothetical protein
MGKLCTACRKTDEGEMEAERSAENIIVDLSRRPLRMRVIWKTGQFT